MPVLRIGMFGGGTVGGGVYELLSRSAALQSLVRIDKICVRSLDKTRDFAAPSSIFTTDPLDILQNADIDCVVEVMGGTSTAKDYVLAALQAGKAVVTANKALLAEFMVECRQAALSNKQPLLYEAAVCGGIPIIHLLQSCYTTCDEISSIAGIINGTTNYMLTKMEMEGADYDVVLKEAQDLGYAESDPTADVEGHDVRSKICLLTKLAFGTSVSPVTDDIPTVGISSITAMDFWYAESVMQGYTIKLMGTAQKTKSDNSSNDDSNNNNKLAVYVSPVLLHKATHVLASISGAGNAIQVTSRNLGTCLYTGPGAGRFPTANSVVADLMRLAQTFQVASSSTSTMAVDPFPDAPETTPSSPPLTLDANYNSRFYIRVDTSSGVTKENMQQAFFDHGIVMDSDRREIQEGNFIMMETKEACSSESMQAWCDQIVSSTMSDDENIKKPLVIPIMEK
jgi:homoserine dehydrogenase